MAAISGGKCSGRHLYVIDAHKAAAIGQRGFRLQHGGMGGKVRGATVALIARVVLFQRHSGVLLAIQVSGVAADAALQPVVLGLRARQPGIAGVIVWQRRGNAAGDHRRAVILLCQRGLALLSLQPRGITQHQRFFL